MATQSPTIGSVRCRDHAGTSQSLFKPGLKYNPDQTVSDTNIGVMEGRSDSSPPTRATHIIKSALPTNQADQKNATDWFIPSSDGDVASMLFYGVSWNGSAFSSAAAKTGNAWIWNVFETKIGNQTAYVCQYVGKIALTVVSGLALTNLGLASDSIRACSLVSSEDDAAGDGIQLVGNAAGLMTARFDQEGAIGQIVAFDVPNADHGTVHFGLLKREF